MMFVISVEHNVDGDAKLDWSDRRQRRQNAT